MLTQSFGIVLEHVRDGMGAQYLNVEVAKDEQRQAINYPDFTGNALIGDQVLLNTTAQNLGLGTGGYDFVMANLERRVWWNDNLPGHIVKGRYLPCQHACLTLEEQGHYADVWERKLEGFPVLVGQLYSQIAPAAAALHLSGKMRVGYIMTDGAALPFAFGRLARELTDAGFVQATFTCGQASGGEYETVTLHSALLAAKYIAHCDAVIACQGPGNAGTGTRYGFSGIEQAQNLDIVKALGGQPIAIVRMSDADHRPRHQGISHHTRTTLEMAYARCIVPVPAGTDTSGLPPGHDVREVPGTQAALDLLTERGVSVTSMGRRPLEDPRFFHAAAAAGLVEI